MPCGDMAGMTGIGGKQLSLHPMAGMEEGRTAGTCEDKRQHSISTKNKSRFTLGMAGNKLFWAVLEWLTADSLSSPKHSSPASLFCVFLPSACPTAFLPILLPLLCFLCISLSIS